MLRGDRRIAMPTLSVTDLHYAWRLPRGHVPAIVGVNANFIAGVPHLICGPSGSGKTTLSLLLAGLLEPDSGTVLLDETPVSQCRNEAAYLFQFPENLFFEETVAREFRQITGTSRNGSVERYLGRLGIRFEEVAEIHPFHLSAGYGRLIATVLQVARKSRILVADEPTIGLDCRFHRRMIELLRECVQSDRVLIIVTHDAELIHDLGGRVWVLSEGRLVWSGDAPALLSQPQQLEQFGLEA